MAPQRDIKNDAALENMHNNPEEISNEARGHKANLSNPSTTIQIFLHETQKAVAAANLMVDTSKQSKEHSKEALKELGGEKAFYGKQGAGE